MVIIEKRHFQAAGKIGCQDLHPLSFGFIKSFIKYLHIMNNIEDPVPYQLLSCSLSTVIRIFRPIIRIDLAK